MWEKKGRRWWHSCVAFVGTTQSETEKKAFKGWGTEWARAWGRKKQGLFEKSASTQCNWLHMARQAMTEKAGLGRGHLCNSSWKRELKFWRLRKKSIQVSGMEFSEKHIRGTHYMPGTVQCASRHPLHLFVMAVSLWGWITIPTLLLSKLRLKCRSGTLATSNLCNSYNTGILITDHRKPYDCMSFPKKVPERH